MESIAPNLGSRSDVPLNSKALFAEGDALGRQIGVERHTWESHVKRRAAVQQLR